MLHRGMQREGRIAKHEPFSVAMFAADGMSEQAASAILLEHGIKRGQWGLQWATARWDRLRHFLVHDTDAGVFLDFAAAEMHAEWHVFGGTARDLDDAGYDLHVLDATAPETLLQQVGTVAHYMLIAN